MHLTNLLLAVITFSAAAAAQEVTLPDWADSQKRSPVEWPEKLHGLVQDESGQPIANAKIDVVLKVQLYPPGGGVAEKPIYRRQVQTGSNGAWSLPSSDFPQVAHRPLAVVVTASAPDLVPWRTYGWYGYSTTNTKGRRCYSSMAATPILESQSEPDRGPNYETGLA